MNIIIANRDQHFDGGQEQHSYMLAKGLLKNNNSVSVLGISSGNEKVTVDKAIKQIGLPLHVRLLDEIFSFSLFRKDILTALRTANVVIINNPFSIFAAAVLLLMNKSVPCISVFHSKGFSPNPIKQCMNSIRLQLLIRVAYRNSTALVFLTEFDRTYFNSMVKFELKPTQFVIPNGIDLTTIEKFIKKSFIRTTNKKLRIIFVGKLTSSKGVKDLLELARIFENLPISFSFAGKGPLRESIVARKNCSYLGVLDQADLYEAYLRSDIFILPSYSESMPMTILEAMAFRLPIITTDIYGLKEVVPNYKGNFLVKPGDVKALQQAIIRSYANREKLISTGKRNQDVVRSKFTKEIMIKKYVNLIKDVVDSLST